MEHLIVYIPVKEFASKVGNNTFKPCIYRFHKSICPLYKWHDGYPEDEDENKDEYVPFDDFLNNYKPIDIVSIDRSVAERWLDFCCDMIEIFKENDKKYLKKIKQISFLYGNFLFVQSY